MSMKNVTVRNEQWRVPTWLVVEMPASVLVIGGVPFWCFRQSHGKSCEQWQEDRRIHGNARRPPSGWRIEVIAIK